ncbi:hypothetical protein, partial [Escherichia coli]|uniref:hypothetical protein n=1 Tax=Escherichia coli TaxID=562 RepID=UPI0034C673AC
CVWHACNPGNRTRKKLAGHNSIYKGNKRLMRRLRVLSDLQPLPDVCWIRRSRRIRQDGGNDYPPGF